MPKITVLIVDDSPFIHKAIQRALNQDAYEICGIAKDGRVGCALYEQHKPDVVTMDITMPVMDGLEASMQILSKDKQAKIIMLSAMGDDELLERAKNIGVHSFIQKPFTAETLADALQKICQETKHHD